MRDLLLKIGVKMGWVTSPSILFDLAMLGEKSQKNHVKEATAFKRVEQSAYYKRYYKKV